MATLWFCLAVSPQSFSSWLISSLVFAAVCLGVCTTQEPMVVPEGFPAWCLSLAFDLRSFTASTHVTQVTVGHRAGWTFLSCPLT